MVHGQAGQAESITEVRGDTWGGMISLCRSKPPEHTSFCVPSCSVLSNSLQPHGLQPAKLLCLWDSPGKKTGVGCHALLQGIFPTQESNLGLLCWQVGPLSLSRRATREAQVSSYPSSEALLDRQAEASSSIVRWPEALASCSALVLSLVLIFLLKCS